MAVKRRLDKKRAAITDDDELWLDGKESDSEFIYDDDQLAALWRTHADRIVAAHIEQWPGTRPFRWWQYQSTEPRRRLGGTGTPQHDCLNVRPHFECGLPATGYITQWQVNYYTGVARDIDGNLINEKAAGNEFAGMPIDPEDPPRFESESAYLKRHGLLLPGDTRRGIK